MKVIRVLNDNTEGYKTKDNYTYHLVWDNYKGIGEVIYEGGYEACEDFVKQL